MKEIRLSSLPHTWLIDIDGTIVRHNGHKVDREEILPGVHDLWSLIPDSDTIVLLSARTADEKPATLRFLDGQNLRYDIALFGLPAGERILINDSKPRGLQTALGVNVLRDEGLTRLAVTFDVSV